MSDDFEKPRELKGVVDRVWAAVLGAGAMVITAVLGPLALEMLWRGDAPRLWFTERPSRPNISAMLWLGLAALWALVYVAVSHAV